MDSEQKREPFAIVGSLYRLKVSWFRPDTDKIFEEVTIDYEAAAQKLAQIHGTTVDNDPWYRPEARMVVDAALGITEDTE